MSAETTGRPNKARPNQARLNHVSVSAPDLEESVAFYEEVFLMERIPTPNFGFPVQWLRAGRGQVHVFERGDVAPRSQHFALTVDDLVGVYERAKGRDCFDHETFRNHLVELPGDTAQLYVRDPGGNLVEVDHFGLETLPAWMRAEMKRLDELFPQSADNLNGRLPSPEEI